MHRMGPEDRPTFKEMVFDENLQREWLCRMVREVPCFGVPEWDGRLQVSRHGGSRTGGLHHIGLKYERDDGMHVEVRTVRGDPRREARLMRVEFHPNRNEMSAAVRDSTPMEPGLPITIPVDDETVGFELWGDETRWWAAATHAGRGVAITAVGVSIADIRLTRIIDLEPYFVFRDEMMRKMRDQLDDPD